MDTDWHAWHGDYDQPDSALARRLAVVRERIGEALDAAPPGPIRVISVCAGQGRDLLGVLPGHPRRADVTARLVELDPRNAAAARRTVRETGLDQVEVRLGDAALTWYYADIAPAHLVLMCGIFGNLSHADLQRTIATCPQLCATGGTLIWTRHRRAPDMVPRVCQWLEDRGFERRWLSEPGAGFGVGTHRFTGTPEPLDPDRRMFTFH